MKAKPQDRILLRVAAVLVLMLLAWATLAADLAIDWHTIGGGGGASSGGPYTISGTLGQPAAAVSDGGGYRIEGGFWSIILQAPGVPSLTVFNTSSNTVVVAWAASSTDYTLEHNSTLSSAGWGPVGVSPTTVGEQKQVVISPTAKAKFYRLKYP